MAFETADDSFIAQQIEQLTELPTVPSFCHGFYRLIAEYLAECGSHAGQLRGIFSHFLLLELWYHRELERMVERDNVSVGDLQSLTDKRRVNLGALTEVASTPSARSCEERARRLILAECHYHRRQTDRVVAHLEAATAAGATNPLVYFALGYNRFTLALEAHVRRGTSGDEWLIRDYPRFQAACLEAVSAFEDALSGGEGDRAIYGWIARALHVAGFHEAAEQAQERSEAWSAEDRRSVADNDESEPAPAPPITDSEIERAARLLRRGIPREALGGSDADD